MNPLVDLIILLISNQKFYNFCSQFGDLHINLVMLVNLFGDLSMILVILVKILVT